MFGIRTRRSTTMGPRTTGRSGAALTGLLGLLSRRRTGRTDYPSSGVAPRRSTGRMTVTGILREVLRHRRVK